MTALSHSFQQIVLTIDEENAEVGCVEPWYEPCEEDPNICVHKRITPELKAEVCREFAALMKVPPGTNMRRVKLLVVRKGMKMSKPCVRCQRVIEALGVRCVYYSCDGALERLNNPI